MWRLALALLLFGPGSGQGSPPAPGIELAAPVEESTPVEEPTPVEGPAPAPGPAPALEGEAPGIEFAIAPPGEEEEVEAELDPSERLGVQGPTWPTPGTAPGDGWGMIVSGAILMPSAALASWVLYRGAEDRRGQIAVLTTGVAFELMGIGFIATGFYRQAKLKRWTLAYRVVARPQGSGLLAAGGVALSFGVATVASGALALTRGFPATGGTMIGVGLVGLGVVAPLTIHFGKRRRDHYLATGGWYRPPLPTVELAPRLMIGHETLGWGVSGRF